MLRISIDSQFSCILSLSSDNLTLIRYHLSLANDKLIMSLQVTQPYNWPELRIVNIYSFKSLFIITFLYA